MKYAIIGLIILALIATASAVKGWRDKTKIQNEYHQLEQVASVSGVNTKYVTVKQVKVLEKEKSAQKLNLPAEIKKDDNKQVTTTGVVEPYEGKTDVVAVLDTQTGENSLIAKQRPLPFAEFLAEKEIGLRLGLQSDGRVGADIHGRWTLGRIGKARVALYGEVATAAHTHDLGESRNETRGRIMVEVYAR